MHPSCFLPISPVVVISKHPNNHYAEGMDAKTLPSPARGQTLLLVTPAASLDAIFEMVARLALVERLTVIDGGNCFHGYSLARSLKRQLGDFNTENLFNETMQRVMLSRVFTCYQMETLLTEGQFGAAPILVLDFLATFYDQNVCVSERRRLLERCLLRLRSINRDAHVVVWVRQRSVIPEEGVAFLSLVQAAAGQVFASTSLSAKSIYQPKLF